MERKPMSIRKLFSLRPGDKFVVYWAKDDDPRFVRLNYSTQTVVKNDGETLIVDDPGYEWYHDDALTLDGNEINTSRGIATFFEAQ